MIGDILMTGLSRLLSGVLFLFFVTTSGGSSVFSSSINELLGPIVTEVTKDVIRAARSKALSL